MCNGNTLGYFRLGAPIDFYHWALFQGKELLMSTTPMELESHGYHARMAHGWVVVMGLGMGCVVYNLLKNEKVVKITVCEKNPDVTKLLKAAAPWFASAVEQQRVEVLTVDAFDYRPPVESSPDLLIADIWAALCQRSEAETRRLQRNVRARKVAWWGQDIAAAMWCCSDDASWPLSKEHIRRYERFLNFSLLGTDHAAYPWMVTRAACIAAVMSGFKSQHLN
jgi:hypothetical protein